MHSRLLLTATILVVACGDSGPGPESFTGLWRLTSVNSQPLPSPGNATGGLVWVAGLLNLGQQSGFFDMCLEVTSTSAPIAQSTGVLVGPISGDKIEVTYFGRREIVPDIAALNGSQLTLRYRNVLVGGQVEGLDVLTFVPMSGERPPVCSLAP